jgi:hypothetical protein
VHAVPADLLFRWAVEILTHDGWEYEQAAISSQSTLRLWQLTGSSASFERMLRMMESTRPAGLQQCDTCVRTDHLANASTFEIDLDGGEMLAVHGATEFARHAAAWFGWSFVEIRSPMSAAHALLMLDSAARDHLAAFTLTAPGTEIEDLTLTGWIEHKLGMMQLVELPAWQGVGESQPIHRGALPSLGKLLRCVALAPVNAFAVRPPCAHLIFAGNVDIASQLQARFELLAGQAGPSTRRTPAAQPLGAHSFLVTPELMARVGTCALARGTFNPRA